MRRPIRKAGVALARLDDAYSKGIVDMIMGKEGKPREYLENPVAGTAAGLTAVFGGGTSVRQGMKGSNAEKGAAVTSAAVRYGAPVVGTTLAAQAVGSLMGSQQTDSTLMV